MGLHLQPEPALGSSTGEQGLVPTLAFSMRMLVLCPLVPSVLCPLPALRMLPMLPSLPTLFLSPAARGKQGARQQHPGIGGNTGHRGPQQGSMCQHSDASKKQSPTRSLRPQTTHQFPSTSQHAQHRQGDLGCQGTHRGLRHRERKGCSKGSPKLPFPASAPSHLAASPWRGGGRVSLCAPAQAGLGTGEGPQPLSLLRCSPDLSCQGLGPSGLG